MHKYTTSRQRGVHLHPPYPLNPRVTSFPVTPTHNYLFPITTYYFSTFARANCKKPGGLEVAEHGRTSEIFASNKRTDTNHNEEAMVRVH